MVKNVLNLNFSFSESNMNWKHSLQKPFFTAFKDIYFQVYKTTAFNNRKF